MTLVLPNQGEGIALEALGKEKLIADMEPLRIQRQTALDEIEKIKKDHADVIAALQAEINATREKLKTAQEGLETFKKEHKL